MQTGTRPDEQDDTYECQCGQDHYHWQVCPVAEMAARLLAEQSSDKLARETMYHEESCCEE